MHKIKSKNGGAKKTASYVAHFRLRQRQSGLRRLEIAVQEKDASFVKKIASTLRADGTAAERLRQSLGAALSPARVKTGADFMALMKKIPPIDDVLTFGRDNIARPAVMFEE